ncbi:metallophosphoesterase [Desulfobotulus sp. H1]|uniref:Metallophosphoesterase n=1 Tax=Desulfobotulus pelophilus TaxID=2823377 RepID=A0ABT3N8E9_9BACT|nr:metallophosphoesterase family protein [Desulfobotulus pelophilus]MCW7753725.1 metallophosphoesterase [Desulfobotulus pelophilus]
MTASFAILSDIHGNLEALMQVLKDMKSMGIMKGISLGDNIGYGPCPNEVVATLLANNIPSVLGNHESGILTLSEQAWFNSSARQALMRTQELLTPATMDHIRKYPRYDSFCDCRFVHGCPPADIRTYLFEKDDEEMVQLFGFFEESICFVGHTHDLDRILWDGTTLHRNMSAESIHCLKKHERAIINCGSVGQPRDGDNRAKYIIYDPLERCFLIRKVPYDIQKTVSAILKAGLPKVYADRLW